MKKSRRTRSASPMPRSITEEEEKQRRAAPTTETDSRGGGEPFATKRGGGGYASLSFAQYMTLIHGRCPCCLEKLENGKHGAGGNGPTEPPPQSPPRERVSES